MPKLVPKHVESSQTNAATKGHTAYGCYAIAKRLYVSYGGTLPRGTPAPAVEEEDKYMKRSVPVPSNQYRETKKKEGRRFQRVRAAAADGELEAVNRMRRHVQKRMQQGWKLETIADRLGITVDQVFIFAGASLVNRAFDSTPRLVRPQGSEQPGLLQVPAVPMRTTCPPDFHFDYDAFGERS